MGFFAVKLPSPSCFRLSAVVAPVVCALPENMLTLEMSAFWEFLHFHKKLWLQQPVFCWKHKMNVVRFKRLHASLTSGLGSDSMMGHHHPNG
jgi:hypothetical protein